MSADAAIAGAATLAQSGAVQTPHATANAAAAKKAAKQFEGVMISQMLGGMFDTFANHRPAYGVTACDVTGDGAPELLLSAYGRQANLLYRNDGAGHFTDESWSSGFAGDGNFNYADNQNFECYCTVHPTQPDCADAGVPLVQCGTPADSAWGFGSDDQPWRNNGNIFSTSRGDVDGDGLNELSTAEIHHWWAGKSSDSSEVLRNDSAGGAAHFKIGRASCRERV